MSSDPIEVLRSFRRLIGTDEHNLALFDAALASLSTSQEANNHAEQLKQARDLLEKVKLYMDRRWNDLEGQHLKVDICTLLWRTGDE